MGRSIRSIHHITIDDLLAHKDDPHVNWSAIYNYVDEVASDKDSLFGYELVSDILTIPVPIKIFLDDYRDVLMNEYDFV